MNVIITTHSTVCYCLCARMCKSMCLCATINHPDFLAVAETKYDDLRDLRLYTRTHAHTHTHTHTHTHNCKWSPLVTAGGWESFLERAGRTEICTSWGRRLNMWVLKNEYCFDQKRLCRGHITLCFSTHLVVFGRQLVSLTFGLWIVTLNWSLVLSWTRDSRTGGKWMTVWPPGSEKSRRSLKRHQTVFFFSYDHVLLSFHPCIFLPLSFPRSISRQQTLWGQREQVQREPEMTDACVW